MSSPAGKVGFALLCCSLVACGGDDDDAPGGGGQAGAGNAGTAAGKGGKGGAGGSSGAPQSGGSSGDGNVSGGEAGDGGRAAEGGGAGASGAGEGGADHGGQSSGGAGTENTGGTESGAAGQAGAASGGVAGTTGGVAGTTGGVAGTTGGVAGTTGGVAGTTGGVAGTTGGVAGTTGGVAGTTGGIAGTTGGIAGTAGAGGAGSAGDAGSAGGSPVDPCDSCDPLVTCTVLPNGHECGPCPAGYSGTGDTACMPNTCPGAPELDCACLKVSPEGSDSAATASHGISPFRTIQAAVDYAADHPNVARKVCVAGSTTTACSTSTNHYADPVIMRNGISVYGKYESASWTRCAPRTPVVPGAVTGISFDAGIQTTTVLDGFVLNIAELPSAVAISVQGAQNVILSSLGIESDLNTSISSRSGIELSEGAEVELLNSGIRVSAVGRAIGVSSTGSSLAITDSEVTAAVGSTGDADAVLVEGGDEVLLDGIRAGANAVQGFSYAGRRLRGISILNTASVQIDASVSVFGGPDARVSGISVEGATEIGIFGSVQGTKSGPGTDQDFAVTGISARGDSVEIRAVVGGSSNGSIVGIACSGDCTISETEVTLANTIADPTESGYGGTGVACYGACTITDSTISGPTGTTCYPNCMSSGTGLSVLAPQGGYVARNVIEAGSALRSIGLDVTGPVRVENNYVEGGEASHPHSEYSYGAVLNGAVNFHSNTVFARGGNIPTFRQCTSIGACISGGAPTLRNNIFEGGHCAAHSAFSEGCFSGTGNPTAFQNNAFDYSEELPLLAGTLYANNGTPVTTVAEINALPDMLNGDNFQSDEDCRFPLSDGSSCIDAGSALGAPAADIDGDTRSNPPDVGADEWTDRCSGVTCSGAGHCGFSNSTPYCVCDSGYENPPGNALDCADVNECSSGNGGCDPLTVCTNLPGSRSCGDCPEGYSGTGETGCSSQLFEQVSAGYAHTCGVHLDGTLDCWGLSDRYWGNTARPTETFTAVSAGTEHTLAIRSDGTLVFWGNDQNGLGSVPPGTFKAVSAGYAHSCAVHLDGTLACWGWNGAGQVNAPAGSYTAVGVGTTHSCGLTVAGNVVCWGSNDFGETTPPSGTFDQISVQGQTACGVRPNGSIECWGRLDLGGWTPPPSGSFLSVDLGQGFACAMPEVGTLFCWGANGLGQASPPAEAFIAYAAGDAHACAIRPNHEVTCWGYDEFGQSSPP